MDHLIAMYCLACRRALSKFQPPFGRPTWIHPHAVQPNDGHEPVPVPLDELTRAHPVCDVCTAENPEWVYAFDEIVMEYGGVRQRFSAGWAVCADCAPYMDRRDVDGLAERAVAGMPVPMQRMGRELTRMQFVTLLPTYKGRTRNPFHETGG